MSKNTADNVEASPGSKNESRPLTANYGHESERQGAGPSATLEPKKSTPPTTASDNWHKIWEKVSALQKQNKCHSIDSSTQTDPLVYLNYACNMFLQELRVVIEEELS